MSESATPRAPTSSRAPRATRLVLAGGGHAQIHVLAALARRPCGDLAVTLVCPTPRVTYTGMIPGALAGLYAPEEAAIDVAALAARAGARFVAGRVTSLRPAERTIALAGGDELAYDVLALDVGARPRGAPLAEGLAHVVPIKPIEDALPRIVDLLAAVRDRRLPPTAVVVGAGAGGVEIAFALRRRLGGVAGAAVYLVERGPAVLGGAPPRLRALVRRLAERARIELHVGVGDVVPDAGGVTLGDGTALRAGLVVLATGAEGLPFLAGSGLRCDARGFVVTDDFLRCRDTPEVFAAGDCGVLESAPWVPRAGVYAVRQGPVLARNVIACATGRDDAVPFRPQRRFLKLLSTGDRRAVLSYGRVALHGRACWWLKDRIDRRFVARFDAAR